MESVGFKIKQKRKEKGLTQKELAEATNLSRSHIASIEGDIYKPSLSTLKDIADALNVQTSELMEGTSDNNVKIKKIAHKIPVLGRVQAGIPIEAVQEVLDYEEISADMAARGEYFALSVRGASMEPRMREGDVVIVRQQEEVETGETAIVLVNGSDATIKKIGKTKDGIILIPTNPAYETMFYSNEAIKELPVKILGKVVELRAKF